MSGYEGFGYWKACPPTVAIAWGARAILRDGYIDIPWDRQTWNGTGKDDMLVRKCFSKLLNKYMQEFASRVKLLHTADVLRADEEKEHTFIHSNVRFVFNTNASHGYLYILAYMP